MRGERQIKAGMGEAQKVALRNAHKKDPRSETLGFWLAKMYEEAGELERAILAVSDAPTLAELEHIRSEVGDLIWSAICAVDHGDMLDLPRSGHYARMIED